MASRDSHSIIGPEISLSSEELFDQAPCGYIFTRPDGTLLKANQTFLKWTGYSATELLENARFQELLVTGSKIYYETSFYPLLKIKGCVNEISLDFLTKEKKTLPVLVSSVEVKAKDGQTVAIKSTLFNMSTRKKYENELLLAQEQARSAASRIDLLAKTEALLHQSPDFLKSLEGVAEYAVKQFSDVCTIDFCEREHLVRIAEAHRLEKKNIPLYTPAFTQAPVAHFIPDFKPQAHPDLANEEIIRVLKPQSVLIEPFMREGRVDGYVSFFFTDLGRRFTAEDRALAVALAQRFCEALETNKLQAEKNRAAQELRESHAWFSTTLRSIGDAVIVLNLDKTVNYLNHAAERLTGWCHEDAVGESVDHVFNVVNEGPSKSGFPELDSYLNGELDAEVFSDTALLKRDGTKRMIEASVAAIEDTEGKAKQIVLVFRDTTERHREQAERAAMLGELTTEKEIREKFVNALTHDLRSPLATIQINIELLLGHTEKKPAAEAAAATANKNVHRIDRMIQNLLDANRMRAGEPLLIEMNHFNLVSLIKEVLEDLNAIYRARLSYKGVKSLTGYWNQDGLRRIIENLCGNALKYGAPESSVTIFLNEQEGKAVLSVHNEGNPLEAADLARLFRPYARIYSAESGRQKGWGLGLALVKGLTEAHRGRVEVTSTGESGTTFTITLPRDARGKL